MIGHFRPKMPIANIAKKIVGTRTMSVGQDGPIVANCWLFRILSAPKIRVQRSCIFANGNQQVWSSSILLMKFQFIAQLWWLYLLLSEYWWEIPL
jgi:hypothetical protein